MKNIKDNKITAGISAENLHKQELHFQEHFSQNESHISKMSTKYSFATGSSIDLWQKADVRRSRQPEPNISGYMIN